MTAKEILPHLEKWLECYETLEKIQKPLIKDNAIAYDSAIIEYPWEIYDEYTRVLAELIGDTTEGWLTWWRWDAPVETRLTKIDGKWKKVGDIKALAKLIEKRSRIGSPPATNPSKASGSPQTEQSQQGGDNEEKQ